MHACVWYLPASESPPSLSTRKYNRRSGGNSWESPSPTWCGISHSCWWEGVKTRYSSDGGSAGTKECRSTHTYTIHHTHATYGSQFPWHIHQVPVVGIRRTEHRLFARVQRIHERSIPTDRWMDGRDANWPTHWPLLHSCTTRRHGYLLYPSRFWLTAKDASPQETDCLIHCSCAVSTVLAGSSHPSTPPATLPLTVAIPLDRSIAVWQGWQVSWPG